jgi:hypothetical protein
MRFILLGTPKAVAYAAELSSLLLHNLTMQPNLWAMQGGVAGVGILTLNTASTCLCPKL